MPAVRTLTQPTSVESFERVPAGGQNCPDGAPSVGAVITNFNGGESVLRCLRSLGRSKTPLQQLVVVDSASCDGSTSSIATEFPGVRIVRLTENLGPCVARNAGLRELSTDLAIVIDDDMFVAPDALGLMLDAYRTSGAQLVCPRILLYPDDHVIQADGVAAHFLGTLSLRHGFSRRTDHNAAEAGLSTVSVQGCPSACFLADRELVLRSGGFEETYFFYFEDLEFNMRLRSLGHSMVCAEQALAYHDRGAGTPGLSLRGTSAYPEKRFYLSARNRLMTILIHYRLKTMVLLLPALLTYELLTLGFATREGFLASWIRAWRWQLENWPKIKGLRARAQGSRRLSDAEILSDGPIPIAPELLRSRSVKWLLKILSAGLNLHWRLVRPCIR